MLVVVLVGVAIYLATRKQKENGMSKNHQFIHYSLFTGLDVETTVAGDPIILVTRTTHSIAGGENTVITTYEAETLVVSNFEPSITATQIPYGVVVTSKVMAVISEFLNNGVMVYEIKAR